MKLLPALAWVALAVVITLGLLWVFQRSLIYLPTQAVAEPPQDVDEVAIETDDGLTLGAWLVSADDPRGAVIVFNGNAGNRSHRLPLGEALSHAGFTVLLMDYRGYGGNPGSATEEGLAEDAKAGLEYMKARLPSTPVIYFGESLGAGVAIGLATDHSPAALILRSPFKSLPDIAAVHYRWLPASLLLRDRFPNVERMSEISVPVLIIAGAADRIVPTDQSKAVYEAASHPRELLTIEGARHNDLALLDGAEMIEGIVDFLDGHVAP